MKGNTVKEIQKQLTTIFGVVLGEALRFNITKMFDRSKEEKEKKEEAPVQVKELQAELRKHKALAANQREFVDHIIASFELVGNEECDIAARELRKMYNDRCQL